MSTRFKGLEFGPDSSAAVRSLQMEWFDQWLMAKDSRLLSKPSVKIFVKGANKWREAHEWPPEGAAPKTFYLESGGKANSLAGDGALNEKSPTGAAADEYQFDPNTPVPTRGGAVCCNPKVF